MMEEYLLGEEDLPGEGRPRRKYPARLLKESWKTMMKNQFRDILPGSSIKEVYEDPKAEYKESLERAGQQIRGQFQRLTDHVGTGVGDVAAFNPYGALGEGIAEFSPGKGKEVAGLRDGLGEIPIQQIAEGCRIFEALGVSSRGYRTYGYGEESAMSSELIASEREMENRYSTLESSERGQFSRIYDEENKREVLKPGRTGNVIMSYEDRPHNYDAWDTNDYCTEKSWEVDQVLSVQITKIGPVHAAVQIDRQCLDSTISQAIYLHGHTPRIDIRTKMGWNEHLIMLEDIFLLDIRTDEASFETRHGNIKRPTHFSTSRDFAKFEVCVHKWLDVSEYRYGISFLNDHKYGCSVKDRVVGLTMLKSPLYPSPDVDKEKHELWYSTCSHEGD